MVGVKLSSLPVRLIEEFFSRLAKCRSRTVLQEPFDRSSSISVVRRWQCQLANGFATGMVSAKYDGTGGSFAVVEGQVFEAAHQALFVFRDLETPSATVDSFMGRYDADELIQHARLLGLSLGRPFLVS